VYLRSWLGESRREKLGNLVVNRKRRNHLGSIGGDEEYKGWYFFDIAWVKKWGFFGEG